MSANIRPLHDRVVIKRFEETVSPGGIVMPDSVKEKGTQRGEVLATGPGKIAENGTVRKLDVKVGDHVLFGKYAGTEVKLNGQDLVMMREEDILGIVG